MSLKTAVLSVLGRDDLKHIVDDLSIDDVDRRSTERMRTKLYHSRTVKVDDLLWYLRKDQLKTLCKEIGLPIKGKRDDLVERLLRNGQSIKKTQHRSVSHAHHSSERMSAFDSTATRFDLLRRVMDEKLCRLWAAAEVRVSGSNGLRLVARATGMSVGYIRTGLQELEKLENTPGVGRVEPAFICGPRIRKGGYRIRRPGAGRQSTEEKYPDILESLEKLLENDVAGDPMSKEKWVRGSLRELSEQLQKKGYKISSATVARLLKQMGFSLKANKRRRPSKNCPERDEQFQYIASQRELFGKSGCPIISVDTKKKELIGQFRNNGKTWCREAEEVDEHDFPGAAECKAVPFGVYDVVNNRGFVVVGVCNNTPEFAVKSIQKWWKTEGASAYRGANELLVLGDSGGANGARCRSWRWHLQEKICDECGLVLTVCHYPPGCSKWNPVEHRLFSYISINWAGKPLNSLDVMLGYIRGTKTKPGLTVEAVLDEGVYRKGHKLTNEDMEQLDVRGHDVCPQWNYTIHPRG